jgi:hypothetical protein
MPSHILTISIVKALKEQFEAEIADLAAPVDDAVYVDLKGKFMGAILYDYFSLFSTEVFSPYILFKYIITCIITIT